MKIALIPNYHNEKIMQATKYVSSMLCENGHEVYVHEKIAEQIKSACTVKTHEEMKNICNLFIALGGDGTIIHAAKHAKGIAILGINMGRLGYMAGLEYSEIDSLIDILNGDCVYENRMLIDVKSGENYLGSVLNDGVISSKLSQLVDFKVSIDDSEFNYRADGLIVATPTGSTAYSLSAGGPVVEPTINCMIFTPICPHTLFNRSIVLSEKTSLKVKIGENSRANTILTMDGREPYEIKENEEITFTASKKSVKLVMKNKKNFFELVNKKLL